MKSIKTEKRRPKITAAISFSLLIHSSLAAILVFGLSGKLISPPKLDGINLVWVSLDGKSKNNGVTTHKEHLEQLLPSLESAAQKPANTETRESAQILAAKTTAKELTSTITLAKYDLSGRGAQEPSKNITGRSATQSAGDTYNSNTVIAYPLYKENKPPVYPEIARVRGYEGIVFVSAEILPDGHVGNMKIRKSSGYAILDQSAIEAVKPWKFEPAKKSGNPFTVWVELPIKFILHNNS
jgi:TonB family protein